MDINSMITEIKNRKDADKIGMILCHNGVVRGTSRDGRKITRLNVKVDHGSLGEIVDLNRKRPGIVEILVDVNEGDLAIGDDLLAIVVAGDIRENVIPTLTDTLTSIKKLATKKTEYFE